MKDKLVWQGDLCVLVALVPHALVKLNIFQCEGTESSEEEFYSSGGILEIVTSDAAMNCATAEIITAQF